MSDWFTPLVRYGNAFSGPYRRVPAYRRPLLRLLMLIVRRVLSRGLL